MRSHIPKIGGNAPVTLRYSNDYTGARRPAHLKGSWVGWQEDSGSQDSSEVGLNCAQKAEVYCAH